MKREDWRRGRGRVGIGPRKVRVEGGTEEEEEERRRRQKDKRERTEMEEYERGQENGD